MLIVKSVPKDKWTTIAWNILLPGKVHWKVKTDRRCRWRRIGSIPWWGKFTKKGSAWFTLASVIQIKSPESTVCAAGKSAEVDGYQF